MSREIQNLAETKKLILEYANVNKPRIYRFYFDKKAAAKIKNRPANIFFKFESIVDGIESYIIYAPGYANEFEGIIKDLKKDYLNIKIDIK